MSKLEHMFVVRTEIDTEKAKPFPDGFKDPATNDGDNGMNSNTYPNWEINYQGREYDFINRSWDEFRSWFEYDGLNCQIFTVNPSRFDGLKQIANDDKLEEAETLIEEVYSEFHNEISLRTVALPRKWQDEHMEDLDDMYNQIIENLRRLLDIVRETINE